MRTVSLLTTVSFFLFASGQLHAQLPVDLYPLDSAVVTNPPAFSWSPNGNITIYLNVSTSSTISVIDVVNWQDNGSHYFCGDVAVFSPYKGQRLYWRLVASGQNGPIRSFVVGEVSIDPYYNVQHMPWPYNSEWQPTDSSTMKLSSLLTIKNIVGGSGTAADRKLGFSVSIPYFSDPDINKYKAPLEKLMMLAEQSDMAVLITLDGFEWWGGRPDLWNWWDTTKPGYNPSNVQNVEWTGWSQANAVKQGWRNWGAPFQLGEPHPNLASPVVIDASRAALKKLCGAISSWYKNLPDEKKYLFAGIKLGWEVSIGINYYYPAGANNTSPYYGTQVGYDAVKTLGLANSGALTRAQLSAVVSNYMNKLSEEIVASGIPRRKIFTHVGALDNGSSLVFNGDASAFSETACPGWSSYGGNVGPGIPEFQQAMSNWATSWAVSEWSGGNVSTMRAFENFHNNKMLNSYDFNYSTGTCSQFKNIIDLPPQSQNRNHWMHPPRTHSVDSSATLTWSIPSQAQAVYLQVSTSPLTDVSGVLKNPNIVNGNVTNAYSKQLVNTPIGKYYWIIIADGCGRRVVSDLDSITVTTVVTGTAENENADAGIHVFPNPSQGMFNVQCLMVKGNTLAINHYPLTIEVYSIFGNRVYGVKSDVSLNINPQPSTIDLSSQPPGIYFMRVKWEESAGDFKEVQRKLIISK